MSCLHCPLPRKGLVADLPGSLLKADGRQSRCCLPFACTYHSSVLAGRRRLCYTFFALWCRTSCCVELYTTTVAETGNKLVRRKTVKLLTCLSVCCCTTCQPIPVSGNFTSLVTLAEMVWSLSSAMSAAEYFEDRTDVQCLHRWQKVLNPELVKGPWTKEVKQLGSLCSPCKSHINIFLMQEDDKIASLVGKLGAKRWSLIAHDLPGRIGKQCRER